VRVVGLRKKGLDGAYSLFSTGCPLSLTRLKVYWKKVESGFRFCLITEIRGGGKPLIFVLLEEKYNRERGKT